MAVYAASLSGGSQIGPVIAGYLIQAKGWRWFFILCAIIAAVNLVATIFLLPETLYEVEPELEIVNDIEKDAHSHVETVTRSETRTEARAKMDYATYWKELWSFNISREAQEMGIFKYFGYLFILPFPLLLVPGVLVASAMYGVILGALVPHTSTCDSQLTMQCCHYLHNRTRCLLSTSIPLLICRSRSLHIQQLHRHCGRVANCRPINRSSIPLAAHTQ